MALDINISSLPGGGAARGRLSVDRMRTPLQILMVAAAQATTQAASFLAVLLVANSLSLSDYGLYSIAITTSFFVAALPGIGPDLAVVRLAASSDQADYVNAVVILGALMKVATSLGITALTLVTAGLIAGPVMGRPETASALRIGAVAGFIAGATTYVFAALQARSRFGALSGIIIAGAGAKVLPVGLLAVAGILTLTTAYVAFVAPAAAILLVGAAFTRVHTWHMGHGLAICRTLVTTSGWLTLGILANSVMVFIDVYVIAAARGPEQVGIYSGARMIAMGLYVFGAGALAVLLPKAAQLDVEQLAAFTRNAMLGMVGLSLPLLILPIFAGPIVSLVLPSGFQGAVVPLRLLSLAFIVELFITPLVVLLIALDDARSYALCSLTVLPFALAGLFAAVAAGGATGAAVVFLAHRLALCVAFLIAALRSLERQTRVLPPRSLAESVSP